MLTYANGMFSPAAMATFETDTSGLPNAATGKVPYCNGQWSGNFLNWAAMTRMDTLRKLLYGGLRSADSAAQTVLERDYLPTDAHAFAKYYNGADISRLTPFRDVANTTSEHATAGEIGPAAYAAIGIKSISRSNSIATITTSTSNPFLTRRGGAGQRHLQPALQRHQDPDRPAQRHQLCVQGGRIFRSCTTASGSAQLVLPVTATASAPIALGDQLSVVRDADNGMNVVVTSLLNSSGASITGAASGSAYVQMSNERSGASPIVRTVGSGASTNLTVTDLTTTGISFCNLTPGSTATPNVNLLSQTNNNPPLLRVARGDTRYGARMKDINVTGWKRTSGQQERIWKRPAQQRQPRAPFSGIGCIRGIR